MLGLEPRDIGLYGSGQKRLGKWLTVGLVQTLAKGIPLELQEHIGHAVVDECHRCPTEQTSRVLRQLDCRYLTGLTATPYRRDTQLSPVIPWHVGPVRYKIERADLSDRLIHPEVICLDTAMAVDGDTFSELVTKLVTNHQRNLRIRDQAIEAVRAGRRCILLSDRVEHVELLADMLRALGVSAAPIHGQLPKALRQRALAALADGRLQAATATYQLLSEGFDCPPINWLCLATPVSYRGKGIQAAGRAMRTAPGKSDAVIFDLMDHHPMLYASWSKRRQAYESLGLDIRFVAPYGTATYPEREEIAL
jgi:superfamily II DNA or RNA helicase